MHGHAAFPGARCDDGFVNPRTIHALAAESGKQRRMDVHNATCVLMDYRRRYSFEVSGQDDEVDPGFAQQRQQLAPVVVGVEIRDVDRCGRRTNERGRVGAVRGDQHDLRDALPRDVVKMVDYCLEI